MSYEKHREIFATRMRLPESARYKHEPSETRRIAEEIMKQPGIEHSWEEAYGRALARQDAQRHHREKAKSLISSPKNYTRTVHLAIIGLLILICLLLAHKAYAQGSTVIRGAAKGATPANNATVTSTSVDHNGVDVNIVGGGGSGGTASNFGSAFPATGTAVGVKDNAGTNMVGMSVDASGYLKINCLAGCAGGATTPSDAFANPTTAGLQATFNMLYNGTTWDRARGDTTNGLWVNCKNGCAGGSSTPSDAFANPTTAGLSQSFNMMWNGTTWDRVKGDTTSGIWINVKNSTLAVTQSTSPWVISFTAPQHVIVDSSASIAVTGPLTDTQLRASAVPISATQLPAALDGSGFLKVHEQGTASVSQSGTWTVQPGNTANTTAWKVDGSAVTQPVSGTVNTSPPANASTNIAQINGVTPLMGSGNTGTGSLRVTLATDQPNLTTALNVNCTSGCTAGGSFADSSAFTFGTSAVSNTSFVVDDVATNTVAENSAGAARMNTNRILYVDLSKTAANTNKLLVTPDSVALPANQSVNVSQINAVTPLMGNGVTGTGSQRVTIASDNTAFSVNAASTLAAETTKVIGTVRNLGNIGAIFDAPTGSAVPANGILMCGTDGTNCTAPYIDPCQRGAKSVAVVSMSTATTTRFIAPTSAKKNYICSIVLIAAAADNVGLIEGTGGTCGTGTAGMSGGTTAATGWNLAANGGLTLGNGQGSVLVTAGTNVDTCLITSASVQLSGTITYVQAP